MKKVTTKVDDQSSRDAFKLAMAKIKPLIADDADKVKIYKRRVQIARRLEEISKEWDYLVRKSHRTENIGFLNLDEVTHYKPLGIKDAMTQDKLKSESLRLRAEFDTLKLSDNDLFRLGRYYNLRSQLVKNEATRRVSNLPIDPYKRSKDLRVNIAWSLALLLPLITLVIITLTSSFLISVITVITCVITISYLFVYHIEYDYEASQKPYSTYSKRHRNECN